MSDWLTRVLDFLVSLRIWSITTLQPACPLRCLPRHGLLGLGISILIDWPCRAKLRFRSSRKWWQRWRTIILGCWLATSIEGFWWWMWRILAPRRLRRLFMMLLPSKLWRKWRYWWWCAVLLCKLRLPWHLLLSSDEGWLSGEDVLQDGEKSGQTRSLETSISASSLDFLQNVSAMVVRATASE